MKFKRGILLVAAVCLPISLNGCKTMETAFDNNCKVGGAAIGTAVGGIAAGLLLGKASGKIGTALLGMAVGGFVGQQIGSMLDCEDKQAVATATQAAGEAPVGQKVSWASSTATVPPESPVTTAAPVQSEARPVAGVTASPVKTAKTATSKPKTPPQVAKASPVPAPAAPSPQWAAVEPVRSTGQSGNWGWVEPVSAPQTMADGRICRTLKQVVVARNGRQAEENVTSCMNDQKQWIVVASN